MKPVRVGVVELLAHSVETPALRARVIAPGTASVMPQAIAAWAEELGCSVHYAAWTSREDLLTLLPDGLDVVFISAFTRASFVAYALSAHLRRRGVVTVLGGPHAIGFAEDARAHFDYVCQATDRALIAGLLAAPERQEPGVVLSARDGPADLPPVTQRARFISHCLEKGTRRLRVVPLLGSTGCPYTCSFCVDAPVPWRGRAAGPLVEDLREIERRFGPDTLVGWQDPNFAVQLETYLGAIDASRTRLLHGAHMSLSLLAVPDTPDRLRRARFGVIAPGVESWFDYSDKSGGAQLLGEAKVRHVASALNTVTARVEHVQTNLIFGLDTDEGDLPFDLTRRLVELAPGIYPAFFLVTNFYNAPLSADLHRSGRTLAVPFPLLDTNSRGNVRPLRYSMRDLYDRLIALYEATFSARRIAARTRATPGGWGKLVSALRSTDEGRGLAAFHRRVRRAMDEDRQIGAFYEGERRAPPDSLMAEARRHVGRYAELLPADFFSPDRFLEAFDRNAEAAVRTLRPPVAGAVRPPPPSVSSTSQIQPAS